MSNNLWLVLYIPHIQLNIGRNISSKIIERLSFKSMDHSLTLKNTWYRGFKFN